MTDLEIPTANITTKLTAVDANITGNLIAAYADVTNMTTTANANITTLLTANAANIFNLVFSNSLMPNVSGLNIGDATHSITNIYLDGAIVANDSTISLSNGTLNCGGIVVNNAGHINLVAIGDSVSKIQLSNSAYLTTAGSNVDLEINGPRIYYITGAGASNNYGLGQHVFFVSNSGGNLNAVFGIYNGYAQTTQIIRPSANATIDLGTSSLQWKTIYGNAITTTAMLTAANANITTLMTATNATIISNLSANYIVVPIANVTTKLTSNESNVLTMLTAANANITTKLTAYDAKTANANITTLLTAADANITTKLTAVTANITGNLIAAYADVTNMTTTANANITTLLTATNATIVSNLSANYFVVPIANVTTKLTSNESNILTMLTTANANITTLLTVANANVTSGIDLTAISDYLRKINFGTASYLSSAGSNVDLGINGPLLYYVAGANTNAYGLGQHHFYVSNSEGNLNAVFSIFNGYTQTTQVFQPSANATVDLGASSLRWKDIYGNTVTTTKLTATDANITGNLTVATLTTTGVNSSLIPLANTYDLGNSTYSFKDLYLTGNIVMTDGSISISGNVVEIPTTLSVDGNIILTGIPDYARKIQLTEYGYLSSEANEYIIYAAGNNTMGAGSGRGRHAFFTVGATGTYAQRFDIGSQTITTGLSILPDSNCMLNLGDTNHCYGDIYCYTIHYSAISDIRLKTNVKNSFSVLPLIKQIRPVTFNWKDTKKGLETRFGFIAQELYEVLSKNGVKPEDYYLWCVAGPEKGTQAIHYDEFIPILTKAIQEVDEKTMFIVFDGDGTVINSSGNITVVPHGNAHYSVMYNCNTTPSIQITPCANVLIGYMLEDFDEHEANFYTYCLNNYETHTPKKVSFTLHK
jgi:hypothetical protein